MNFARWVYRVAAIYGILEKIPYAASVTALFAQGRVARMALVFGFVDSVWAALFFVASIQTEFSS